ncbi:protein SENESCENCE-ASSOCIATED GENE 21, mitochondrial-like [Diospyros lotus]|uniref:protein SENESCENCE-ASSOCIATED GENE 21, mitochondrial-like n=1 Tax=Diospyros lotus TaxID=55363 RepID=UPI002253C958|nr:protein SENESCENCE-ASSOCIATED GENE 21, mitochondrial-like [Diospyros lotus]
MARNFSNAKLLSAFVLDRTPVSAGSIYRRGYASASASQGVMSAGSVKGGGGEGREGRGVLAKKGGEESAKASSWVPDPVTGDYRPENQADQTDVAELREMHLKNNIRRH